MQPGLTKHYADLRYCRLLTRNNASHTSYQKCKTTMLLNILQCVVEMVALSSYIGMERLAPLFDRTVNDALVQEFQFPQNTLSQLFDGLNCPCVDLLLEKAPHPCCLEARATGE